jgi:hypothetical protein
MEEEVAYMASKGKRVEVEQMSVKLVIVDFNSSLSQQWGALVLGSG